MATTRQRASCRWRGRACSIGPVVVASLGSIFFFFFNATATTGIYTLSLHDALPISPRWRRDVEKPNCSSGWRQHLLVEFQSRLRSEEHTSELQSRGHLVCRLLLEKKKTPRLARATPADRPPRAPARSPRFSQSPPDH